MSIGATVESLPEAGGPRLTVLADLVDELVTDAVEAAALRAAGKTRGPVTGLEGLDEALGGYLAPGVHLLQAAPGAGKTALALQVAATCGFPCLFVSAEMPALELFRRVISRTTGCFLGRLKSGEYSPEQVRTLALKTAREVPALAFLDSTRAFASGETIHGAGELLKSRFDTHSLLVVVDSIQAWARGSRGEASEYDLITAGLTAAEDLARGLRCPTLCVSRRNRPGQKSGGMHAGKGSGDLEYAAESLSELTPAGEADGEGVTSVTLTLHKNRHGAAGIEIPLQFCGRRQIFTEA